MTVREIFAKSSKSRHCLRYLQSIERLFLNSSNSFEFRFSFVNRRALNLKCTNAKHPDLYGHYREAKFTQTKHHWWWKANRVFDQLLVTRNHTGMVLFLEEDHYVAEDFLHVLRLMERTCKLSCERCNVLSLGTYLKTYNYFTDFSRKVRTFLYFWHIRHIYNFALRDVSCTK